MMTVYLAGPIAGCSYEGATDWRESAAEYLWRFGIRGVSPMRAKEYLKEVQSIAGVTAARDQSGAVTSPVGTSAAVVCRDRFDCTHADAVLFNLIGATRVSIGTMMEVAWADLARVPSVLAMEPTGNVHEHGMVTNVCGFRAYDLDEALDVVVALLRGSAVDR